MVTEYIAKIKGDTSDLEKALSSAQGSLKRISDDEVIVKLNYDGNIKGFNKTFDSILKACPDLTIQFQYDANKKLLEQELDKLNLLNDFKLDIDTDTITSKVDDMTKRIKKDFEKGSISGDEFINRLQYLFKYINTANAFGFEIDTGKVRDELSSITQYAKEISKLSAKQTTLFPVDDSAEGMIEKQKERIAEINKYLDKLKELGASDLGIGGDTKRLEDEIKIINEHIKELREEMSRVSGEKFEALRRQVNELNDALQSTLDKLGIISESTSKKDPDSLGQTVAKWSKEGIAGETPFERYTPFNSESKRVSQQDLISERDGISEKLIRSSIEASEEAVDGFMHSHPENYAAFSDADVEAFYTLASEGITNQIVMGMKDVMSIDMSKVDLSKKDDVVEIIQVAYKKAEDDVYETLRENIVPNLKELSKEVFSNVSTPPALNDLISTFKTRYNEYLDSLDGAVSGDSYFSSVTKIIKDVVGQMPEARNDAKLRGKLTGVLNNISAAFSKPLQDIIADDTQRQYQNVLQKVFSNPEYLKGGMTSALKIDSLEDFIDYNSVRKSVEKAVETAKEATEKAQKSSSPSKVAEELGKYWTDGYAKGIIENKDEVEEAIKELIKGGQLTMLDLFTDQKNIMSEEQYAPLIEPIKNIILSAKPELAEALSETLSETVSPSQEFDNEVQKNLVYLENYKNTIKEIDRLKLEPETEETKKKIEELNDLAEYFVSNITSIRSENGHTVSAEMMKFGYSWAPNLNSMYTNDQLKELYKVAQDNHGVATNKSPAEYSHITEELKAIEAQSELTRQSLTQDLITSRNYANKLADSFEVLVETREELSKSYINEKDKAAYQKDIDSITSKYPEILEIADKFKTWEDALKFTKSEGWNDFLATLPKAHTYLESIGYDFEKINAPELLSSEQAFAQYGEELDEIAKQSQYTKSQLDELYKSGRAQDQATSAVDALAEAYEEISKASTQTSEKVDSATESIKEEGKAAKESTKEKEKFTKANKEAAQSGEETAKGAKKAADAVKEEAKVFKENADLSKWLADIQSGTNTIEFSVAINKEMAEAELKKIAPSLAEEFNKQYGTSITSSQVVKAYKTALKERQAAEAAAIKEQQKNDQAALQAALEKMETQPREDVVKAAEAMQKSTQEANAVAQAQIEIWKKYSEIPNSKLNEQSTANANSLYDAQVKNIEKIHQLKLANLKLDSSTQDGQYQIQINEQKIADLSAETLNYQRAIADGNAVQESREQELVSLQEKLNQEYREAVELLERQSRQDMSDQVSKWAEKLEKLQLIGKYTSTFSADLANAISELRSFDSASGSIDEVNAAFEKLSKTVKDIDIGKQLSKNKLAAEASISKLNLQIEEFTKKNSRMGAEFRRQFESLKISWDTEQSTEGIANLVAQFNKLKIAVTQADKAGRSFTDVLKERITGLNAQFLAQYFSWQDWIRYIRELGQNVVAIDTALTELRKVSDASTERLRQSFETSAVSAKELGSAITDVINITSDWARLGYDVDQAEDLARVTTLFKTVGDNMTAEDASSYLVSTLQGFQMSADQSEAIVDKYNQVANNFAIDTRGIGEALQRSAASFNAANTDLSKSIALITATNEVVQNPESVGRFMPTSIVI